MKSMFSRLFKVVCTVALGAALFACGSSKTVDPFTPNRVIGLGDAYNDVGLSPSAALTVTGTSTVQTVVEQVAALFGVASRALGFAQPVQAFQQQAFSVMPWAIR